MDLLKNYESDSCSVNSMNKRKVVRLENEVDAAPDVDISELVGRKEAERGKVLQAVYGEVKGKNHLTGHIEDYQMNHFIFHEQCENFKNLGWA